jgi:membrane-bound lytic murein transglycosylase B
MRRGFRRQVSLAVAAIAGACLIGCGGASAASPQQVAEQIAQNDSALRSAIDSWRAGGDPPATPPPQDVLAQAASQQALVEYLADHTNLATQVLPLLSGGLRTDITQLYAAKRDLLRLSAQSEHRKLKLGARPPFAELVGDYQEANRRLGIGAHYLAAIHLVETKFGRVKNNSVAGAQGPMQFIPSTWRIYGRGGDIQDPHDAILAAARLLRANGAPARYGPALRAYNPSGLYVDAVSHYAKEIARNPYALYSLYCWEP